MDREVRRVPSDILDLGPPRERPRMPREELRGPDGNGGKDPEGLTNSRRTGVEDGLGKGREFPEDTGWVPLAPGEDGCPP